MDELKREHRTLIQRIAFCKRQARQQRPHLVREHYRLRSEELQTRADIVKAAIDARSTPPCLSSAA